VPDIEARIKCFKYLAGFEGKKEDLKPDIHNLNKCSVFVKNDTRIMNIFKILLQMGNFLNAPNKRLGGALGFSLDTVNTVADFKTSDNKSNLFEVMIEQLKDKKSPIIDFKKDEIQTLEDGARVNLQTVEGEFRKLQKEFEEAKKKRPSPWSLLAMTINSDPNLKSL